MEFDWYEYTGVFVVLIISVALIFKAKSDRSEREPQGDSSRIGLTDTMSLTPIVISLVAANTSGMSLLAKPAESYKYGVKFCLAYIILTFFLFLLTHSLFATVLYRLKDDSIYEYLEKRFGRSIKKLAMVTFIVSKVCGTSLVALPPAIVLSQFTGLPISLLIGILLSITTCYTAMGGYLGVVLTDTFQGVVMFFTMVVLTVVSIVQVGGPSRVMTLARQTERWSFAELTFDPTARLSVWTYLIAFSGLSVITLNQSMFQRYKSLPKKRDMVFSMWFQYTGIVFFQLSAAVIGLAVYAYYDGCDPKSAKLVNNYENVIVFWVNDVGKMVKGIRGVYIAGITCASISTISTHINSCSGLICKEWLSWTIKTNARRFALWLKLNSIFVGALATSLSIAFHGTESLLELSYCLSAVEGVVSGFFILGVVCIPANTRGTLIGGLISFLLTITMTIGSQIHRAQGHLKSIPTNSMRTDLCHFNTTPPIDRFTQEPSETVFYLFRVSPFLMTPFATLSTIILGFLLSLVFKHDENPVKDPDLFSPCVHRLLRPSENRLKSLENPDEPFIS